MENNFVLFFKTMACKMVQQGMGVCLERAKESCVDGKLADVGNEQRQCSGIRSLGRNGKASLNFRAIG